MKGPHQHRFLKVTDGKFGNESVDGKLIISVDNPNPNLWSRSCSLETSCRKTGRSLLCLNFRCQRLCKRTQRYQSYSYDHQGIATEKRLLTNQFITNFT